MRVWNTAKFNPGLQLTPTPIYALASCKSAKLAPFSCLTSSIESKDWTTSFDRRRKLCESYARLDSERRELIEVTAPGVFSLNIQMNCVTKLFAANAKR